MIKIIVTFATFVSLAAPIASAHAWQLVNGRELNGRELNGRELNGRELNGRELNGRELNGRELNGRELNGRELNGTASGSSILTLEAIELPAKTR